jgi:hypothetical protein
MRIQTSGGISFSHCLIEAHDADDAYSKGPHGDLPPLAKGAVMNDYVVCLND